MELLLRPQRTVRFSPAGHFPDTENATSGEDTRPFELPAGQRKARRRAARQQTWVTDDLRKDGTCPPQRDTTTNGWRVKVSDDLLRNLVSDPLLGTQTFDEQLKFARPRYSNRRLNEDWKRAVVAALNLFREVYPECTPEISLAPMRRSLLVHEKCGKPRLPISSLKTKICRCMTNKHVPHYLRYRNWTVDSGCTRHAISRGALNEVELDGCYDLEKPQTTETANGTAEVSQAVDVHAPYVGCISCDILETELPVALMSPGQLVQEGACDFHWTRSDGPQLVSDDWSIGLDVEEHPDGVGSTPHLIGWRQGKKEWDHFFGVAKRQGVAKPLLNDKGRVLQKTQSSDEPVGQRHTDAPGQPEGVINTQLSADAGDHIEARSASDGSPQRHVDAGIDVISQTSRAKKRRKRPNKLQKSADTKDAKSQDTVSGGVHLRKVLQR